MTEYSVYGQRYGAFVSLGWDTDNGATVGYGVQGALPDGVAGALGYSWSSNKGYEGHSVYIGGATPTGKPGVVGSVLQNYGQFPDTKPGDFYVSWGRAVFADIYEVGVFVEGGPANYLGPNLIKSFVDEQPVWRETSYWQSKIDELERQEGVPDQVKIEMLRDFAMARTWPSFREEMGQKYYGETVPRYFPAHTRIQTSRTTSTAISALRVGDVVLAFDARADKGRGALVPRRVTRLYRNTTTEWLRLRWVDGTAREGVTTPDPRVLGLSGRIPVAREVTRTGRRTRVGGNRPLKRCGMRWVDTLPVARRDCSAAFR